MAGFLLPPSLICHVNISSTCYIVNFLSLTQNYSSPSIPTLTATMVYLTAAAAKSLKSCLTLCDPIDGSPPGSVVPRILQARTLEWVAISFSNAWKWKVKVKSLSPAQLFTTPWTAAYQAPLSMGFSRQEYWSELPSPSPVIVLLQRFYKNAYRWLAFMLQN